MIFADTSWSLGVLVGVPTVIVLSLLFIGVMAYAIYDDFWPGFWMAAGCLALTLGIAAWAFYPYSAEYHQWQSVDGTIDKISSRILRDGDAVNQRFVVRFTDGRIRSCDDTRCALLTPGDELRLACKREWQFSGTDGWSCNYKGSSKDEA